MCHTHLRNLRLILLIAAGLTACRANNDQVRFVNNGVILGGSVELPPDLDLSTITINRIDEKGIRQELEDYSYDESTRSFNFKIANEMMLPPDHVTDPDRIVAMGGEIPKFPLSVGGSLGDKTLGVARFEFIAKDLPEAHKIIPYTQWSVAFSRSDILGVSSNITSSNQVTLAQVGSVATKVVDEEGNPIKDAKVIGIVAGEAQDPNDETKTIPAWQLPLYRPIQTSTNDEGKAVIAPLNIGGEVTTFQILAFADNFCTYVTPVLPFKEGEETVTEIKLKKCEGLTEDQKEKVSWTYEVLGGIPSIEETSDSGEEREVIYANKRFIKLRLDSYNQNLRGLSVKVIEEHNPERQASLSLDDMTRFTSEFDVELPKVFETTGSADGAFIIKVSAILAGDDSATYTTPPETLIYGRKSIEAPDISFVDSVTIKSSEGIEDVVSGLDSGSFKVETIRCFAGFKLGIQTSSQDIVYASCEDKVATFKSSDIVFPNQESQQGGPQDFKIFLKNLYNNVSSDDPANRHRFSVHIDYGLPTPATDDIQLKMGIAPASEPKGTTSVSYTFPTGGIGAGNATLVLTAATIDQFVFRFRSPTACFIDPNEKDGNSDDKIANTVKGYKLAGSAEDLANISTFTQCADGDTATDHSVDGGKIVFPSSSSDKAYYMLQFIDNAGNVSEATRIEIPPCPGDLTNVAICWKP